MFAYEDLFYQLLIQFFPEWCAEQFGTVLTVSMKILRW